LGDVGARKKRIAVVQRVVGLDQTEIQSHQSDPTGEAGKRGLSSLSESWFVRACGSCCCRLWIHMGGGCRLMIEFYCSVGLLMPAVALREWE